MAGSWTMALLQAVQGAIDTPAEPKPAPEAAPAPAPEAEPAFQAAWQAQVEAAQAAAMGNFGVQMSTVSEDTRLQELQARSARLEAQMQVLQAQGVQQVQQMQRAPQVPASAAPPLLAPLRASQGAAANGAAATSPAQSQSPPRQPKAGRLMPGQTIRSSTGPSALLDMFGVSSQKAAAPTRTAQDAEPRFQSWEDRAQPRPTDEPLEPRYRTWQDDYPDESKGRLKGKGKGKYPRMAWHDMLQDRARVASAVETAERTAAQHEAASSSITRPGGQAPGPGDQDDPVEKHRCHLHKKPLPACKFCTRYVNAKKEAEHKARQQANPNEFSKRAVFNCSPLLLEQILKSSYYRSLSGINLLDEFVQEIVQYCADTMDVYKSTMEPSCFICCVYRLHTMSLQEEELRYITDNQDSPLVRCVGFLFMRYSVPPEELWERLEEFILDDAKIFVRDGGKGLSTTIGEYIEGLLLKDKYLSTPLPRIPAAVRRRLEERIAPLKQYRKRTRANRKIFARGLPEPNMPVEVCISGHWQPGRAVEVLSRIPSRLKVRVKLGNGDEHIAHIGKVVLCGNPVPEERAQSRSRSRSHSSGSSHGRQRGRSPNWSRSKGKSDVALVDELRGRAREEAVCHDRKEYAKRLPRYEKGLAIRREQGSAEMRLIEEETFITMEKRRRPLTQDEEEERERVMRSRTEEEEERQRKLKDIYERYGQQKSRTAGAKASDLEGPDTLRLG
mmetsp:Transcript_121222/g.343021  ORF Transcript_121222/g.343021 Transcript_121222/m.343021 type:complete len:728 (-) Transcript_121222:143-2326(-)